MPGEMAGGRVSTAVGVALVVVAVVLLVRLAGGNE